MSPPVCPEGHESEATDYCDTCGSPMGGQPSPPVPGTPSPGLAASVGPGVPDAGSVAGHGSVLDLDLSSGTGQSLTCPHCGASNVVDALFCEACGYDFTTGAAPLGAEPEVEPQPQVEAEPEVEPQPQVEAEPEVEPQPEAESEPDVEPEVALGPEPDGHPVADDEVSLGDAVSRHDEAEVDEAEVDEAEVDEPEVDEPDSEQAGPVADEASEEPLAAPPPDGGEDHPAAAQPARSTPAREAAVAHARPRHTPPSRDLADTWVVEIWVDPDWYAVQQTDEAVPSPGVPDIVVVRRNQVLVGRPSGTLGVRPDVDSGADTAVSRRHAQLTSDGRRWWIEDLGSSNGTFVGVVGDPLPTEAIRPGQRVEIDRDDRIYVGAWTRLVLRQATEAERKGQG